MTASKCVVWVVLVLVLEPHLCASHQLHRRKSYSDIELRPPDLCEDQAKIAQTALGDMLRTVLHWSTLSKGVVLSLDCARDVRAAIESNEATKPPFVTETNPAMHRISKAVFALVHRSALDNYLGEPAKPTSLFPWQPGHKSGPDQATLMSLAGGSMYGVAAAAYLALYLKRALAYDESDSLEEKGIVRANFVLLLALFVVFVVGYVVWRARSKWAHTVTFMAGRSPLLREDVFAAVFVLLLWAIVFSMVVHYYLGRVDEATLSSFFLKMVGYVGVARAVLGFFVSDLFRTEENWRERLEMFLLRHLTLRGVDLSDESELWGEKVLRGVWKAALPPSCLPPSHHHLHHPDPCTSIADFPFAPDACTDPPSETPQTLEALQREVERLQDQVEGFNPEHESRSLPSSPKSARQAIARGLHVLVQACAVSYLCEKTHTAAQVERVDSFLSDSTDTLTLMLGAMGASALLTAPASSPVTTPQNAPAGQG